MSRKLVVEIIGDPSAFQASLAKATASTTGFAGRMKSAGESLSSVGKKMTRDLSLPIVGLGVVAGKTAMDFQSSMELISTQAGVPQRQVDKLSKSVLALAGPVATAPETLSQGLFHLASQGLRGQKAMDALRIAAEGAKVGQANLEDVTNALGAALVSGIKGTENYQQAMGALNAVVGAGDMHMQDLADAMGTGLPAKAALAGVSLRDVGAALAVFGDNNIRGAKAGTDLASAIRLMSAPSKNAAKELATVGLSATSLAEAMRSHGLVAAVQLLKEKMDAAGLSANDQNVLIARAFGGKQATGVSILVDQLERLKTKTQEVGAGADGFGQAWQKTTQTTAFRMAQMGAQMQAAGVTIGNVLLPVVAEITDKISGLVQRFQALSPGMKTAIVVAAGFAAVIGPVVGVVGATVTAVSGLAAAFGALSALVAPLAVALGAPAAAVAGLVVGVAALAAGIAAAVLWPDKFRAVLERMGLSAHAAGEVVSGLQDVFQVVKTAALALMPIFETVWQTITATVRSALEVIRGIIDLVTGLIHGDWSKVWQGIREIVSGTLGGMVAQLRGAVGLLGDVARLIGEAVWKGIVQPIARLAGELLSKVKNAVTNLATEAVSWASSEAAKIGEAIIHGIEHGFGGLLGELKSHFEGGLKHLLSSLNPFSPVEHGGEIYIGQPIAQGAIKGYLEGIAPLPTKISATLRSALEQAKSTIDSYRSQFSSSWGTLVSDANQALKGIQTAGPTEAGGLLAGLTATNDQTQFAQQMSQAQAGLQQALAAAGQSGPTPDQVQQLADAQTKQQVAQDQLTAAVKKYGEQSDQARKATLSLHAAEDALAKVQQQVAAGQSTQVAGAFSLMQAALQNATAAVKEHGAVSKQAVSAQQELMRATQAAQEAVAAETGAQQQNDQAVVDAQNTMNGLLYSQMEAALQARDQLQQKHRAAAAAHREKSMDAALRALERHLKKEGATHKRAQAEIIKLLHSYGVSYKAAGAALGNAFASGIESTIAKAAAAAEKLAHEVSRYLPHSPAEKGPLSQLPGWADYLLPGLAAAADAVGGTMGGLAGPGGARVGVGAAASGVALHVTVQGSVIGSDPQRLGQELGDIVEPYITRRRVAFTA